MVGLYVTVWRSAKRSSAVGLREAEDRAIPYIVTRPSPSASDVDYLTLALMHAADRSHLLATGGSAGLTDSKRVLLCVNVILILP